jgi:hypothetical protein
MKAVYKAVISIALMAAAAGAYVGTIGNPFFHEVKAWSIGIYTGESPLSLSPPDPDINPVLTARQITDVRAAFVADPFMVQENSRWYMFFEIMNKDTGQGDIGLAVSADTITWRYERVVLDEPFHVSYPYVFKWNNEYYMIPESGAARSIRLYKAVEFPTKWEYVTNLLSDSTFVDPSIFEYNGKLWLLVTSNDDGNNNNNLRLFYADDLAGRWFEHPRSPVIVDNPDIARSGGRVVVLGDRIIRYAQDDYPTYGSQVRAFAITELNTSNYREEPIGAEPIVKAGTAGWSEHGMHTIDAHQLESLKWVACVDGKGSQRVFGFR